MTFIQNFTESLHKQLQLIELEESNIIDKASASIALLENQFAELKSLVVEHSFKDKDSEIHFFKKIKPHLSCKLIYYKRIYNIEMSRPAGSNIAIKSYLEKELNRIHHYFEKHIEFYKYYRGGHTHFDHHYFLRKKPDIQLVLDSFYFERDLRFSTCCDFIVAKILANDMLTVYINNELERLEKASEDPNGLIFPKVKETWTGSKTDLVELIYALCEMGCFNFGKMSLKRLTDYFENVFNVDLGDVYHTYLSIRGRNNRTQFLDELKSKLIAKMNKDDQK
ncbi:MAG: RteC domain-containing protein [Bacteroidota bacterium]|nr:RteC domain-containing protein [Bacteroidota bacterium]